MSYILMKSQDINNLKRINTINIRLDVLSSSMNLF